MEDDSPQTCQEVGVTAVIADETLMNANGLRIASVAESAADAAEDFAVSSRAAERIDVSSRATETGNTKTGAAEFGVRETAGREQSGQKLTDQHYSTVVVVDRSAASTSWTYRIVSAGLAFSVWGGWGYFVNSQEVAPATSPVISGLLHGLFSSMVTIVMLTSVTWLYRRFAAAGFRMLIPAATTSLATGSCITTAHVMIGTANVPATVIPGLVVAFCFNIVTTKKLHDAEQVSSSAGALVA